MPGFIRRAPHLTRWGAFRVLHTPFLAGLRRGTLAPVIRNGLGERIRRWHRKGGALPRLPWPVQEPSPDLSWETGPVPSDRSGSPVAPPPAVLRALQPGGVGEADRRRRLRAVLGWAEREGWSINGGPLQGSARDPGALARALRSRLELVVDPAFLGDSWVGGEEPAEGWDGWVFGQLHRVCAREVGPDPGPDPEVGVVAAAPTQLPEILWWPSVPARLQRSILAAVVLPAHLGAWVRCHLIVVLPDETPLPEIGAWVRTLRGLVALEEGAGRAVIDDAIGGPGAVRLTTRSALQGVLDRRLSPAPADRLAWREARCVGGRLDKVPSRRGPEGIREELPEDFAAAWVATRRLLGDPGSHCSLDVHELVFGRWPAVLRLARGLPPADGAECLEELALDTDPRLVRVGSEGLRWTQRRRPGEGSRPAKDALANWRPELEILVGAVAEALP